MKRICLTVFFTLYTIFIPFVTVNCSVADEPYVVTDDGDADDGDLLAQCEDQTYVTADCVDVLQAESERVAEAEGQVSSAEDALGDFETCKTEDGSEEDTTSEAEGSETIDCGEVVADIVAAYEICSGLNTAEKYSDCSTIEDSVDTAMANCDVSSSEVTESFCSLLKA